MNHLFKQQSIKDIAKYNQGLLVCCVLQSAVIVMLSVCVFSSKERWVIIPTSAPDTQIHISSAGYSETYLGDWAKHVMRTLMTTSFDTVDSQISELKVISSNSAELNKYLQQHLDFIKGSNIQSVFFPKGVSFTKDAVVVSGLFKYWLGASNNAISIEKKYRLSYKRGIKDIILLKEVKEVVE